MTKGKPLTILLITLILVAVISFFVVRPVVTSVWASWRDLNRAREDLKTVEEKRQVLEALKQNKDLSSVSQIALKYIPKESESGELVIELTAIAAQNNLIVEETSMEKSKETTSKPAEETATPTPKGKESPATGASPSTTSATGGAKEVEFSMKLSGSYTDFMNFLRTVESSARLIVIKNIAMQTKQEAAGKTPSFTVQLEGVAYYKSEVTIAKTLDNIKISDETLAKFLNLKTYGIPINLPQESGFGRTNPFENY